MYHSAMWRGFNKTSRGRAKVVSVRATLAVGLVLVAVALAVTLTRSPPVVVGSDFTPLRQPFAESSVSTVGCQAGETLPPGTSAIRLSIYSFFGPRVTVAVLSGERGERVLTSGVRDAGWIGESPTVAVRPVRVGASGVRVCFALGRMAGLVSMDGSRASPEKQVSSPSGSPFGGRMRIDYLEPGSSSWLSQARSVARRMGLGHWAAGAWIALLAAALMAGVLAAAMWLTVRELR